MDERKDKLNTMIYEMEKKLLETTESTKWRRSAVDETLEIVIPMMMDQLAIMREIVNSA